MNTGAASLVVQSAVDTIRREPDGFGEVLDAIPAPLYVTDPAGTITYYNPACIEMVGRTPELGRDKWCVSWRLYTPDGEFVPHDQCPMAVAIRERRAVRDAEAVAERPDGRRVHFIPFPTPVFDAEGEFTGAVNLLLDVTDQRTPRYLRDQAARCRRLANSSTDAAMAETLQRMALAYDEQADKSELSETRPKQLH